MGVMFQVLGSQPPPGSAVVHDILKYYTLQQHAQLEKAKQCDGCKITAVLPIICMQTYNNSIINSTQRFDGSRKFPARSSQ